MAQTNAQAKIPQQELELKVGAIKSVKVYSSRADVEREHKINLVLGEQAIIVKGFPTSTVEDSLRVTGTGPASVLEVSYQTVTEKYKNPECTQTEQEQKDIIEQCDKEIEEIALQKHELQNVAARLLHNSEFLDDYSHTILQVGQQQGSSKKLERLLDKSTLTSVQNFTSFYKQQMASVDQDSFKLKKQVQELDKKLDKVRERKNALKPLELSKQVRQAVILVQGLEATQVTFKISYHVNRASWKAAYDVRLRKDNSLELTYFAVICQNSDENWKDVALALSTAQPQLRSEPPTLQSMVLGVQTSYHNDYNEMEESVQSTMARGEKLDMLMDKSEDLMMESKQFSKRAMKKKSFMPSFGGMMMKESAAPPPPMQVAKSKSEQGATSSSYMIERPSSIPSDNKPHKVTIATIALKDTKLEYTTAPAIDTNAYLKAKATNPSEYTFLPGPVSVFFDNTFVCTTTMKNVSPSEEFESYLGHDENVKIEFTVPQTFRETTGIISTANKMRITNKIIVKNNKPVPIFITVKDRFPISQNSNCTISQFEPDFPKDKTEIVNYPLQPKENKVMAKQVTIDKATNVLTFEVNMNPNSKVIIPYSHTMEWPTGYELQYNEY